MSNNVAIAAVSATPVQPISNSAASNGSSKGSETGHAEAASRYRLVIEEGSQKGSFVYKTMDRVTGEVIRQFPREQVMKMMESDLYGSGTVIDTTI